MHNYPSDITRKQFGIIREDLEPVHTKFFEIKFSWLPKNII